MESLRQQWRGRDRSYTARSPWHMIDSSSAHTRFAECLSTASAKPIFAMFWSAVISLKSTSFDPQAIKRLADVTIHPLTDEMQTLAKQYVQAGIFPAKVISDALHVAAAVLSRNEILISWNFKHLVNRRRRAAIASINLARNLPSIEIVAPPEL